MTTDSFSMRGRAWQWLRGPRSTGPAGRREGMGDLEGAVQSTLAPVRPQSGFRENLRENLALAARGRATGLAVDAEPDVRQSLYLGITAGLLAVAIAALVVFSRYRADGE